MLIVDECVGEVGRDTNGSRALFKNLVSHFSGECAHVRIYDVSLAHVVEAHQDQSHLVQVTVTNRLWLRTCES